MTTRPSGTVTFLLTDIEGSTRLWERHPKAMPDALAWHDTTLRGAIQRHGGYVFATGGDGFAAAFANPMEAASAAVEAQQALRSRDWGELGTVAVRMALDTGIAEERDGDYFGPPVNRASRIMSQARGGQVLASHTTADLLRHHLDEGIRLVDIGQRQLRDVDRAELLYAVEFGPAPVTAGGRRRRYLVAALLGGVVLAGLATWAVAAGMLSGDGRTTTVSTATAELAPPLPDFTGWYREDAYDWLEQHGLVNPGHRIRENHDPSFDPYAVLDQEYAPGTVLPVGTSVRVISKDQGHCDTHPDDCEPEE